MGLSPEPDADSVDRVRAELIVEPLAGVREFLIAPLQIGNNDEPCDCPRFLPGVSRSRRGN